MSLFTELKRRSVFRVAIGYFGVSWLIIQVVETVFGIFDYQTNADELVVIFLAIGFVPAMILAWVFELTPEGIKRDVNTDRDTLDAKFRQTAGPRRHSYPKHCRRVLRRR